MLLSGAESALLDCDQCTARRPFLTNDQQALIEGKAQSIPPHLLNLSKVSGLGVIHITEDILKHLLVSGPITLSSIQGLYNSVG